jgi:catalase
MVANYQRDGHMRVDGNGGSAPNYFPNSFDDITVDESYKEPAMQLESTLADWYDRNAPGENDHYSQPGTLFNKVMTDAEKRNTVNNIVGAMSGISGPKRDLIINRQLCHLFRASIDLGVRVAQGLGVDVAEAQAHMSEMATA